MLFATVPDGRELKCVWNSKFHEHLTTYVMRGGAIEAKATLPDLAAVDAWAIELGAREWTLRKWTRVSPFAARLPIRFPDAPGAPALDAALARVRAGVEFKKIAAELGTDPVMARAWLMGHAPGNADVARLQVPGLLTLDIDGGRF